MGLTTISDIEILYQQIVDLQKLLEEKIKFSDNRIQQLEVTTYKNLILSLEDANWSVVRKKRNYLLKISDWTMTAGCTVNQHDWAVYRQQLRDLPQTYQFEDFIDILWPDMPSPLGPHTKVEELLDISGNLKDKEEEEMPEEEEIFNLTDTSFAPPEEEPGLTVDFEVESTEETPTNTETLGE